MPMMRVAMCLAMTVMAAVSGLGASALADTSATPTAKPVPKLSEMGGPFTKFVVREHPAAAVQPTVITAAEKVKSAWEALGPSQLIDGPVARCPDRLFVDFVEADAKKKVTVGFCAGVEGPARVSNGKVTGGITIADLATFQRIVGR
jgi:hypothetical protein